MDDWKQKTIDWRAMETLARAREAGDLATAAGLSELQAELIRALMANGQTETENEVSRSVWTVSARELARVVGSTRSGVRDATARLVALKLLRTDSRGQRGTLYRLSWSRVFALARPSTSPPPATARQPAAPPEPASADRHHPPPTTHHHPPPPTTTHHHPPPTSAESSGPMAPHGTHAHARPRNQEPKKESIPIPIPNQTKKPIAPPLSAVLEELFDPVDGAARFFDRQLERLTDSIASRLRAIEDRLAVEPSERLQRLTARRIARGMTADPDSDAGDELEKIFGSLARADSFQNSPAAYLVVCCQRRGWLPTRTASLADDPPVDAGRPDASPDGRGHRRE